MSLRRPTETKPAKAPWIAAIPTHWDERPFFAVAKERRAKNTGMKEANLLSLSYGNVIRKDINTADGLLPESFETYQIVEADDVVFRLTDLQNDKRSLRSAICRERGIITSAYLCVRPEGVIPAFMNYLMRAYDVQKVFYSMGGGLRQSLGFEDLRRMSIVAPDQDEQREIVRFLDRETSRVDRLIEKKGRFIAVLQEKRAAMITHAVTKGVTQTAPDTPRSDGAKTDWALSEVRLDQMFEEVKDLVPLDGIELLTPSVVHGVVPQASLGMRPQQALRENYRVNLARPDDFVISLSSHAHGIEYCGISGGISPDYTLLRPTCDPRLIPFLRYALKSKWIIFQMGAFKTGVRMGLRLQWNKVRFCRIGVPSPQAAGPIAAFLDGETARIDALITKTERSIELLREKRSALITAAVTGKIDVRSAA